MLINWQKLHIDWAQSPNSWTNVPPRLLMLEHWPALFVPPVCNIAAVVQWLLAKFRRPVLAATESNWYNCIRLFKQFVFAKWWFNAVVIKQSDLKYTPLAVKTSLVSAQTLGGRIGWCEGAGVAKKFRWYLKILACKLTCQRRSCRSWSITEKIF